MDAQDYNYDKIAEFVLGRLTASEMAEFEKKIKDDPDFALEVEIARLQFDMVRKQFDLELENQIEAWDKEAMHVNNEVVTGQTEKKNLLDSLKSPLGVFSIITLLFSAVLLVRFFGEPARQNKETEPIDVSPPALEINDSTVHSTPASTDQVHIKDGTASIKNNDLQAAKYLGLPYMSVGAVMSESSQNPLTQGLQLFRQKDYKQAYQRWSELALSDENYRSFAQHGMAYASFQMALHAQNDQDRKHHLNQSQQLSELLLKDEDMEQAWPNIQWNLLLITLVREGENSAAFQKKAKEFDTIPEFSQKIINLRKELYPK